MDKKPVKDLLVKLTPEDLKLFKSFSTNHNSTYDACSALIPYLNKINDKSKKTIWKVLHLRLSPDAEKALNDASTRSGLSLKQCFLIATLDALSERKDPSSENSSSSVSTTIIENI
jgi:hypothetical protein